MQDNPISSFIAKASSAPQEQSAELLQQAIALLTEQAKLQAQPLLPSQLPPSKKAIEKVCRGIGHDFNGILANIRGMVEITQMMSADAPEQVKSAFDKILAMVERGHHASELIRCYGKVHDCQKSQFELSAFMKRAVNDVRIHLDIPFQLPCTKPESVEVVMDSGQLEILLMQLVKNGFDALQDAPANTSTEEKHLTINVAITPENKLQLEVRNKGKAIANEVGEKVYEPFYSTKKVGRGLGLGLSIVKQIVMNHDGEISYSSSAEQGTTFTCVMPVLVTGN